MKSVLISIRPQWTEKIASGEMGKRKKSRDCESIKVMRGVQ